MKTGQHRTTDSSGVVIEVEYPAGSSSRPGQSYSQIKHRRRPSRGKAGQEASADLKHAQLNYLHEVLGSYPRLGEAIGANQKQAKSWASGEESPSEEQSELIASLSYVVQSASKVWSRAAIWDWLNGRNAFLGGATPLDMVRRGRMAEVLQAVEGEASGAYA
jgi:hypothetical protein